jgi:hypothetical protein
MNIFHETDDMMTYCWEMHLLPELVLPASSVCSTLSEQCHHNSMHRRYNFIVQRNEHAQLYYFVWLKYCKFKAQDCV